MNYFELFELPISFKIDHAALSKKYFELQKKFHPDFFSQSSSEEQTEVLQKSSQINRAYKIFRNEEETIKYLLMQKGLLEEEEKYQLPASFLMEMMELNEDLSPDSPAKINEVEKEIYAPVKDIIEKYDDAKISTEELLKVKEYYYQKKYLQRILDRISG